MPGRGNIAVAAAPLLERAVEADLRREDGRERDDQDRGDESDAALATRALCARRASDTDLDQARDLTEILELDPDLDRQRTARRE